MDAREFYETTKAMRAAQKEFFKTRESSALKEAKRLERVIDDEISRVELIEQQRGKPQQLTLF